MFQTLKARLTASRSATAQTTRRFAPQVETLHDRITPTATVTSSGNLIIGGTAGDDDVTVTRVMTLSGTAYG